MMDWSPALISYPGEESVGFSVTIDQDRNVIDTVVVTLGLHNIQHNNNDNLFAIYIIHKQHTRHRNMFG